MSDSTQGWEAWQGASDGPFFSAALLVENDTFR
jgi:hypothetical protein